jgi:hypothetical protein
MGAILACHIFSRFTEKIYEQRVDLSITRCDTTNGRQAQSRFAKRAIKPEKTGTNCVCS